MRAIILIASLTLASVAAHADQLAAANAAVDFDQASALAAHARFEAGHIPNPGCVSCESAWPSQKATQLALQLSMCQSNYPASPEYAQACSAWWRTVLQ